MDMAKYQTTMNSGIGFLGAQVMHTGNCFLLADVWKATLWTSTHTDIRTPVLRMCQII